MQISTSVQQTTEVVIVLPPVPTPQVASNVSVSLVTREMDLVALVSHKTKIIKTH